MPSSLRHFARNRRQRRQAIPPRLLELAEGSWAGSGGELGMVEGQPGIATECQPTAAELLGTPTTTVSVRHDLRDFA